MGIKGKRLTLKRLTELITPKGLRGQNQPYRFRYRKGRDYKLHEAAAGLLYMRVLDAEILGWLIRYPDLWGSLLYLLAGNYDKADSLGEIVGKADRISVAANIGANPVKVLQAPVQSLQKHLLQGLRHLLQNELKLNQKGAAGWLTQEGLWLVSKVVSDKLRAYLLSQGFDGIPSKNSALFDELQAHGIIEANHEGNAIWKALVVDGDWQQEFTFLKITPSMVWGSEEPPPPFTGTVTVLQTGEENAQPPEKATVATVQETRVAASAAPLPAPSSSDGIDDVLALFSDTAVSEPLPVSDPIPAASAESPDVAPSSVHTLSHGSEIAAGAKESMTKVEIGGEFLAWLKAAISANRLQINDSNAKIHVVEGQLFVVTPGIFQRFCEENAYEDWKKVQRGFEKLKIHKKRPDDLNIWSCSVKGPRKDGRKIKGYFINASLFFNDVLMDNPFINID